MVSKNPKMGKHSTTGKSKHAINDSSGASNNLEACK
jgi:hypothetical protein